MVDQNSMMWKNMTVFGSQTCFILIFDILHDLHVTTWSKWYIYSSSEWRLQYDMKLIYTHTHTHMQFIHHKLHSPCVKLNIQTKINPNPHPGQVDKVMDAAQEWCSVVCAWRDRGFLCLHLICHQSRQREKFSTFQAPWSPRVCLCSSKARTVNDPKVRLQWEREPTSQSVSSAASQAKRQGGGRWLSQATEHPETSKMLEESVKGWMTNKKKCHGKMQKKSSRR